MNVFNFSLIFNSTFLVNFLSLLRSYNLSFLFWSFSVFCGYCILIMFWFSYLNGLVFSEEILGLHSQFLSSRALCIGTVIDIFKKYDSWILSCFRKSTTNIFSFPLISVSQGILPLTSKTIPDTFKQRS